VAFAALPLKENVYVPAGVWLVVAIVNTASLPFNDMRANRHEIFSCQSQPFLNENLINNCQFRLPKKHCKFIITHT
jgi:hypothetical protein